MKFYFALLLFIFSCLHSFSQKPNEIPLKLSYGVSKTNYKAGDTLDFVINVKINAGWYIYSSAFAADGPMPFECSLDQSNEFTIIDTIRPYKPFSHYDEVWEGEVKIFEDIAQFRLKIVVKKAGTIAVNGKVMGQVCSDLCVPIEEKVTVDLSSLPFSDYKAADPSVYKHYEATGQK